jgi:hypothetical protein
MMSEPALNWAIIMLVMNAMIRSEETNPTAGLPKRSLNKSGTVIAPLRREICARRFPTTANAVSGTTM